MAKKIIIGNWKMNPTSLAEAKRLYTDIKKGAPRIRMAEIVICPPAPYLAALTGPGKSVILGAQDSAEETQGAFTGSSSPLALKSVGVQAVILGHSERRAKGEADDLINLKIKAALKAGLRIILCVGETVRDEQGDYLVVLRSQLESCLADISKTQMNKIAIAYEPVWAIGAQATSADTPEGFLHNAIYIRQTLSKLKGASAAKTPILYGGSVSVKNAESFLVDGKADGLLVGRESLKAKNFLAIAELTSRAA
ncbi:MAG TPA: triose-phosphate isomerase [Candidatus Paceibacterota bacterium]|nr:triose-phosphate isomerase [Candidatus Paceibacterota bacterium]